MLLCLHDGLKWLQKKAKQDIFFKVSMLLCLHDGLKSKPSKIIEAFKSVSMLLCLHDGLK